MKQGQSTKGATYTFELLTFIRFCPPPPPPSTRWCGCGCAKVAIPIMLNLRGSTLPQSYRCCKPGVQCSTLQEGLP